MPRIRCLIGPSPHELTPIEVNSSQAHDIKSDLFEGKVSVFIKLESSRHSSRNPLRSKLKSKSRSPSPNDETPEYFRRQDREGVTWSIQVQGRFLKEYSSNDILFGNTFDRPLHLPWGSGAVLKFMHYIDPVLEHDLSGAHPWALSPLISTMPYFHHRKTFKSRDSLESPSLTSVKDDISELPVKHDEPIDRRSYFASQEHREELNFGPTDIITTDFCYGFLTFPSLSLSLPAGMSFDLTKYWDGQPVRFVCCERHPEGFQKAKTFWCVVFEIVDDIDDGKSSSSQSSGSGGWNGDNRGQDID